MVLRPKTIADISVIEDQLADIVAELRKIRAGMVEKGLDQIDLETEKAERFVSYLREEWITRCMQRYEKTAVKASVSRVRQKKRKE